MPIRMRLNKHISDTGHCSRREADRLVAEGRVIRAGRRILVVAADVFAETGGARKHVAMLQGTMIPV